MTEPEVWQQLEDAFRNREWTRAAILADALQECGQEALADTVRWAASRQTVSYDSKYNLKWSAFVLHRDYTTSNLYNCILWLEENRRGLREYLRSK